MPPLPRFQYDAVSALSKGRRDYQEDSIATDFPLGADLGFVVLADGMGGHACGDIASKIIVTEVFSELKLQSGNKTNFADNVASILCEAAISANECVSGHVSTNPESTGMGATLIAPVLIDDQLSWVSIGDSPLFLFRNGTLKQLNEDHSMAPQIDFMIKSGLIGEEAGKNHPDRNCLTSVLIGDEISHVDCPAEPFQLFVDDILIVASDGLQFLSDAQIECILESCHSKPSTEIAYALLKNLEELDDPDQDNISLSVIKIGQDEHVSKPQKPHLVHDADTPAKFQTGRHNGAA